VSVTFSTAKVFATGRNFKLGQSTQDSDTAPMHGFDPYI
jgi:hypothetical protein